MEVKRKTRELHLDDPYTECNDVAHEIGKFYMADLRDAIETGRKLSLDKLWLAVNVRKNPIYHRKLHIKIGLIDKPLTKLRESFDLWEYNYPKEELTCLWSLPHRYEMKNYLSTPDKFDPKLIHWINQFLKQEGIDKKDLSCGRLII